MSVWNYVFEGCDTEMWNKGLMNHKTDSFMG